MARYLVTGGCGFIGRHLVGALLARGADVQVLDDLSTGLRDLLAPEARLIVGDVADPAAVREAVAGADGIFHLAAVASVARCTEHWLASHRVNLFGTVAVLEAARDAGRVPVVYASSAAVYGDDATVPLTEAGPARPLTAYGVDKLGAELHAGVAGRIHGVPSFGLRLFNVYGAGQAADSPYSGVVSIFLSRMRAGREVVIEGDGEQVRDFVHVEDAVAHFLSAMPAADRSAPVANVATGCGTSIVELARLLAKLTGYAGEFGHGPARAGDIRASVGDPALATRLLGCRAGIALADGLAGLLGGGQAER